MCLLIYMSEINVNRCCYALYITLLKLTVMLFCKQKYHLKYVNNVLMLVKQKKTCFVMKNVVFVKFKLFASIFNIV